MRLRFTLVFLLLFLTACIGPVEKHVQPEYLRSAKILNMSIKDIEKALDINQKKCGPSEYLQYERLNDAKARIIRSNENGVHQVIELTRIDDNQTKAEYYDSAVNSVRMFKCIMRGIENPKRCY